MNTHEKKYARSRIETLRRQLLSKAELKYTKHAVELSSKERAKAFKQGKFKFQSNTCELYGYTRIDELVKFDDEKPRSYDKKKYQAFADKIRAEETRVIDEIMLGDNEEALRLIQEFSKFKL